MPHTLLEEYIKTGNTSSLKELLEKEPALAKSRTSHQVSPLMLSCYFRQPQVTKMLLSYLQEISFFEAVAVGKFDIVAHMLYSDINIVNQVSEDGFTPLGLAAFFGHEEITRYLLLKGADPNSHSQNGFQVYPIHSATTANHSMIVKMLLEGGADVNVKQMSGVTPLHSAAHNGNIELLILLLEAGAEVKARMDDGRTPADMAAENGFKELAKILAD